MMMMMMEEIDKVGVEEVEVEVEVEVEGKIGGVGYASIIEIVFSPEDVF